MRHHARRLLAAAAAAACCAAAAAPAGAVEVRIDVTNAAAPAVRIVSPADGARVPLGDVVRVRVEGEGTDALAMSVDARPTWSGAGRTLAGEWKPAVGEHRLVAVGTRAGAPDAVDAVTVRVIPPDDAGAAPPAAPGPGAGEPPAVTPAPSPSPGAPGPRGATPGGSLPPVSGVTPPLHGPPARPAPSGAVPAPVRSATVGAPAAAGGGGSRLGALARAVGSFLSSPERAAWAVAFPLVLLIAAVAYALLQRFIDGGPKLAWRGRGHADDEVIEF